MHLSIHQQVATSESLEALPSSKEEESETQAAFQPRNSTWESFREGGCGTTNIRLTVFAVAVVWFYYVMSCQVKMCFHRAAHMMTERSRALRRYQAWDSQVNARPNTSSIHFVFDFCPIGVDGNASCCMGNHPDQFEDLQLITDGKSVSGIGSEVIIKGLCTFEFDIKDDILTNLTPSASQACSACRVSTRSSFHPIIGLKKLVIIIRNGTGHSRHSMMTALSSTGPNLWVKGPTGPTSL